MPPITQGSTLSVDDAIGSIVGAFRAAEDELRRDLERVVQAVALDPTSTKRYRDAQIRGILGRVSTLRADLEGQATLFANERLGAIYRDGMSRADRLLAAAGRDVGQGTFTALHREALEVLAADTFDDLAAATDYLDASTKRTIREATKLRTTIGAARGTTVGQDTRALVAALERGGVTGFVDRAGRSWRISTYAEMVTRTKSAHAYNTGTVLRAEETGTTTFEIYDGERSGHDACLAYNRKTCTAAWALAHPTQHPNCVRAFGPLPLHTGGVDYGAEGSGTAADRVRAAADERERAAIERLERSHLTASDLDLSGLPVGRSFRVEGTRSRPTAHSAEIGPGTARVSHGRLHYVEDDALAGSPYATMDEALDAIEARLADAIPDGLDDAIRSITYTAGRNPQDVIRSAEFGREFTSAATSNGPGIVMWQRGASFGRGDRWLGGSTIDHETGHSIMHLLNRRANDAVQARRAAAAENILDDVPEWLTDTLDRLDLDPLTVPFESLEQLAATERARRLQDLMYRRDVLGEDVRLGPATAGRIARELDGDLNELAVARDRIRQIGQEFTGNYATPGRGFVAAGEADAVAIERARRRYARLESEVAAGTRDVVEARQGIFVVEVPAASARVQREIGIARFYEDRLDGGAGHPIVGSGRGQFANQPERPAVTEYAASIDDAVEDWAESWRLWLRSRTNGRLGVDAYGRDVTFDDLYPNRAAWIRDLFDLVGLEP